MNRKSIAEGVFRNPAIQKLLKEGDMPLSQINKLIVEEVMSEDELQEMAADHATKNINKFIRRQIKKFMEESGVKKQKTDKDVLEYLEVTLMGLAQGDPTLWKAAFPRGHESFTPDQKEAIQARAVSTKNKTLDALRTRVKNNDLTICPDNQCNLDTIGKLTDIISDNFANTSVEGEVSSVLADIPDPDKAPEDEEQNVLNTALDQLEAVLPKYKAELEKFEQPTSSDGRPLSYFEDADDHPSKPFVNWFKSMLEKEEGLKTALGAVQRENREWFNKEFVTGGTDGLGFISTRINQVKETAGEEAPEGSYDLKTASKEAMDAILQMGKDVPTEKRDMGTAGRLLNVYQASSEGAEFRQWYDTLKAAKDPAPGAGMADWIAEWEKIVKTWQETPPGGDEGEEEVSPEVEELVDQVEPQVEAEEERTGQAPKREDIETLAREEVSNVAPGANPDEQEKLVQQAADRIEQNWTAAESERIYLSFDDNEKEALRLFQQFLSKKNLLQEVQTFRDLIGIKEEDLQAFVDEIKPNKPVLDGFMSLLMKVERDNKQMRGVNWFLDNTDASGEPTAPAEEDGDIVQVIADNIDKDDITKLSAAFPPFRKGFMKVPTLKAQSDMFNGIWVPIRSIAGVLKHAVEKTAAALSDEGEAELQEQSSEIVQDIKVFQRHLDSVERVLDIYQQHLDPSGELTVGSMDALKEFGESDPRELLYKMVKLLMGDINGMLEHINSKSQQPEQEPEEKENWQGSDETGWVDVQNDLEEVLREEVEVQETRADKIQKVRAMYDEVVVSVPELLQVLTKVTKGQETRAETQPGQVAEQEEAVPANPPEVRDPENKNDQIAMTAKERAMKIYEVMAVVKEYFPTANPLKSEHTIDYAVKAFKDLLNEFKEIIPQLINLGQEKNVTPRLLSELESKLERAKKRIIDIFGVTDTSRVGALNKPGQDQVDQGRLDPEPSQPTDLAPSPTQDTEGDDEDGEIKEGVPTDVSGASTFIKFMTKPSGLMTPEVERWFEKFEYQDKNVILQFLAFYISSIIPEENIYEKEGETLEEASASAIRAFLDKSGLAFGQDGKESEQGRKIQGILNKMQSVFKDKEDPEGQTIVDKFMTIMAKEKTTLIPLMNAVRMRLSKFRLYGNTSAVLASLKTSPDTIAFSAPEATVTGDLDERLVKKLIPIIKAQLQRVKNG